MDVVRHQAVRPNLNLVRVAPLPHQFKVVLVILVAKNVGWRRFPRWVI
jgi:hypothetical protein